MSRILIADDRFQDRELLRAILEPMGHDVVEAHDGEEAYALAREQAPDLILSDILMPRLDGFSLARRLQEDPDLRRVPFAFVTATYGEQQYRALAHDLGAVRVLLKPYEASEMRALVKTVLEGEPAPGATQRLRQLPDPAFHERHARAVSSKLEQKLAELEAANAGLRESEARAGRLMMRMIDTISKMVEYRDPYTTGHERRVGNLAAAIAAEIGLDDDHVEGVRIGGYLHDVGKISAPSEILSKPAALTGPEFALIKLHAEVGHDILAGIDFPWPVAEMAWQHHERVDGSGYPRGLAGEHILLEARILAVADTVEAMSSHRPYRAALGIEAALAEIEQGRGTRYDLRIADVCLRLFRDRGFSFT